MLYVYGMVHSGQSTVMQRYRQSCRHSRDYQISFHRFTIRPSIHHHIQLSSCVPVYICMYVSIYLCMYECMCVYVCFFYLLSMLHYFAVILHAINLHVSFICRRCSDQHHDVNHCIPFTILNNTPI